MFPTSDEPSGYDLHSVKIARLAIREIAEIDVDIDDDAVNPEAQESHCDDPRQQPKSAIERGTESLKHTPPKTAQIVNEPTYLDMKKKQARAKLAEERGDSDDSSVDRTDPNDPQYVEYVCIDVE
jgi:hypothetical protein